MIFNKKLSCKHQRGFSLVELMVGMVVGMVVVGGSLSIFLSTLGNSNTTLEMSKLNQNMAAVMQLLVNEVRRSGYVNSSDPSAPTYFDSASACLLYSYDKNFSGNVDSWKKGVKLISGTLVVKNNPSSCGAISAGVRLTDSATVKVTDFVVDISNFKCVNIETQTVMPACSTAGMVAGDQYVTIREVGIQLRAESIRDSSLVIDLNESVRIRNDLITTI